MEPNNLSFIDMITPGTQLGPNNIIVNVRMTQEQYDEMMYCIDQVRRNRERARLSYYERKGKEEKKRRNIPTFPTSPILQQPNMVPNNPSCGLQLVINKQ